MYRWIFLLAFALGILGNSLFNLAKDTSVATAGPLGLGGKWKLVFQDDFDGNVIDRNKWVTCYWWDKNGCTNLTNKEQQWYTPGNVVTQTKQLFLTAKREFVSSKEGPFDFTSGLVSTGRAVHILSQAVKFDFLYGYAEIRARVPKGRGLHPAFWMLPSNNEAKPEVDIMEVLGHQPNVLYTYFHYLDGAGKKHDAGGGTQSTDLSNEWHVFGIDWEAERLTWYLDGKEVRHFDEAEHIPREPMYLLLNLAVGGKWPGPVDESTKFPANFLVDYVRVWQR